MVDGAPNNATEKGECQRHIPHDNLAKPSSTNHEARASFPTQETATGTMKEGETIETKETQGLDFSLQRPKEPEHALQTSDFHHKLPQPSPCKSSQPGAPGKKRKRQTTGKRPQITSAGTLSQSLPNPVLLTCWPPCLSANLILLSSSPRRRRRLSRCWRQPRGKADCLRHTCTAGIRWRLHRPPARAGR